MREQEPTVEETSKFSRVWLPRFTDLEFKSMDDTGKACFIGLYIDFKEFGDIKMQYDVGYALPNISLFTGDVLGRDPLIAPNSYLLCVFLDWTIPEPTTHGAYISASDCGVFVQIIPNVVYKKMVAVGEDIIEVIAHNPKYEEDVLTYYWYNGFIYYPNYYVTDDTIGKGFSLTTGYSGYFPDRLAYLPVSPVFKANWYGNPYGNQSLLPNSGRMIDLELHPEYVLNLLGSYYMLFEQAKLTDCNDGVKKIRHSFEWLDGKTSFQFWGENAYDIFYMTNPTDGTFLSNEVTSLDMIWTYVQSFAVTHLVTLPSQSSSTEIVEEKKSEQLKN